MIFIGRMSMGKCPYCKQEIGLSDIEREVKGIGFLKQEIMYSCPHCGAIIGISRGNYG